MKSQVDVLTSGQERARTGPWRAGGTVAFLAPAPEAKVLSPGFVVRCLEELAGRGFASVVTTALTPAQTQAFITVGFEEHERLRLLSHDLGRLPAVPPTPLRRARRRERERVLEIDSLTFPPFWRLDDVALEQAIRATRATRFRVTLAPGAETAIVGYAITGLGHGEGYMQRLAVAPDHQRAGRGRALALDGLHWLRRRKARRAVVNTQSENDAAFSLYVSLGFRPEAFGLAVLRRDLTS